MSFSFSAAYSSLKQLSILKMINGTANIYVSIGQALRRQSDESQGYRRAQHTYLISVEPHQFHVPGMPQHQTTITHFEPMKDNTSGNYGIVKYTSKNAPGIIGNILIAESAHTSVEKVHKLLSDRLPSTPESRETDDSFADNENEHFTRMFIHALQDQDVAVKFRIDEFMTWIHSYVADRLDNQAPALIAYPKAHREHEKKSSKHSFWRVNSMKDKTRKNSKGEATMYGGSA